MNFSKTFGCRLSRERVQGNFARASRWIAAVCWVAIFAVTTGTAGAEVRLPHFFSDHMVLQRDAPIHIWGWAAPGEEVRVSLNGHMARTAANAFGQWSAYLKPSHAGGPYDLKVQGAAGALRFTDILMGDLWIASGQSNMEMPLAGFNNAPVKDGPSEIAAANHPEIRLLRLPRVGSETPQDDVEATWTRCTPESAKDFSAVAYFFGRELHSREGIPIGLVDSTWGGTPAEAWTSMNAFGAKPSLALVWSTWQRFTEQQSTMAAVIADEKRDDDERRKAGLPIQVHPWHPEPVSFRPSSLYNGMVAPLTPLSIRGVIWYQGETNSSLDRAPIYHDLFSTLIEDWRAHFAQGPFPFIFAQISSYRATPKSAWGVLRDAQRRTLAVSNTAMAVTLDVGSVTNVHPPDKQTVGHRLALAARSLSYGESVQYAGPLFARADIEESAIRVSFQDRKATLVCSGGKCIGFEVAGADHIFVPADATLDGETVVVKKSDVKSPAFVRYAWANVPDANLTDSEGLPASTFTSEGELIEVSPLSTAVPHQ